MKAISISAPTTVHYVLSALLQAGYEAYYVGGCVRDTLRGVTPHDWDIATSALPQQTLACFPDCTSMTRGMIHGTVTLRTNDGPIEVTTFRVDGDYRDARHPDCVRFSSSLREDLSRRDFTVNALAATVDGNIINCNDGITDLQNRIIRCVGDPFVRFEEDALRILRALRFASTLSFQIDAKTAEAARQHFAHLQELPKERIETEIHRLLCGDDAVSILTEWKQEILPYLPLPVNLSAVQKLQRRYGDSVAGILVAYSENTSLQRAFQALLAEQSLLPLSALAVRGDDLIRFGLRGAAIGAALQTLLGAVRRQEIPNEKSALLAYFSAHSQQNQL